MPGLLQAEDYAREVLRTANGAAPPREIERMVEARMVRQRLLQRDPPFELTAVIDESVLMRLIGSDALMVQQINRLLDASEYPHLSLRILPLNGVHPVVAAAYPAPVRRGPRGRVPRHRVRRALHQRGLHRG